MACLGVKRRNPPNSKDQESNPQGKVMIRFQTAFSGESGSQTSFLLDSDLTPEEQEEKARLIAQVLELQNTLDDLRCDHKHIFSYLNFLTSDRVLDCV